jgi:16S rRNA (adenine1518-N6/adenine1519-N6)-dimethyltransferase
METPLTNHFNRNVAESPRAARQPNLMTIETLKSILAHYQLSPNKTYGQNFLMDETILEDMIDRAGVNKKDCVLEVGPGIGNLTERLLGRAGDVVSIEKDPQFLNVLKSLKKQHANFEYQLGDILTIDFSKLVDKKYKVVANIPYYITGKIVQLFLKSDQKPTSLTLLMQKEVAQNIVAKPGRLNLLAISTQLYADAELVTIVPSYKFYPAPKVDSAVVHIELHRKPKYKIDDEKKLFRILKACFAGKRKQLHNTLTNNLKLDKSEVDNLLHQLKIDKAARPQQLTIEQWLELTNKLQI